MNFKGPLQVQAYETIKKRILEGGFEKNVLYSETKLASELGISRTPMREALQCLAQDGYITVIPSKGFMIRQLNKEDMVETIQIRCAIEGFCAQLIASEIETKKGKQLLKTLGQLLERQEKSLTSSNSLQQFMDYDHKFHLAVVEYADNQEFSHIFQRLMYLIHLTTSSALSVPGRVEATLDEHRQFYDYLAKGDGDSAYRLMVSHLMMPLRMHIVES